MPANAEDKTEAPTPRRREQTREQGRVARSQDLSAAVPLLAGLLAMGIWGQQLWIRLLAVVTASLAPRRAESLGDVLAFSGAAVVEAGSMLAPFLLVVATTVVAVLLAQVGVLITFKPLLPSLSKISPLQGVARIFSVRSLMSAAANFGKLLVVVTIVYLSCAQKSAAIMVAATLGLHDVVRLGAWLLFDLGIRLAVALVVLALLDYAWQRYRHERDMRMTKEEVKDEFRNMEGDVKLKARRRQVQLQLAMQRIRRDVPKADVVVTNPTHVAVAIAYDNETMPAPKVVAKGADHLAARIRRIALECGVPIIERPPLARAMYESVDVGQYVPERFYRAIAEILAYVYELTGRAPAAVRRELSAASGGA